MDIVFHIYKGMHVLSVIRKCINLDHVLIFTCDMLEFFPHDIDSVQFDIYFTYKDVRI